MLPTVISKNTMGLFGLGLSDMGAAMLVPVLHCGMTVTLSTQRHVEKELTAVSSL